MKLQRGRWCLLVGSFIAEGWPEVGAFPDDTNVTMVTTETKQEGHVYLFLNDVYIICNSSSYLN